MWPQHYIYDITEILIYTFMTMTKKKTIKFLLYSQKALKNLILR